jgi:hypothetical protein
MQRDIVKYRAETPLYTTIREGVRDPSQVRANPQGPYIDLLDLLNDVHRIYFQLLTGIGITLVTDLTRPAVKAFIAPGKKSERHTTNLLLTKK